MIHRGANNHHRPALRLVRIVGKLARHGDQLRTWHAGNAFLPCRGVGRVVVKAGGAVGLPGAPVRNTDNDIWAASKPVVERWILRELSPAAQVRDLVGQGRRALEGLARWAETLPAALAPMVVRERSALGPTAIVLAVAALAIFGYRSYSTSQNAKASTALYAAQAPMAQGKFDEATKALDKVEAKAKKIAAHLLEASAADIVLENGEFKVAGTDKKVPFAAVSLTAYVPHNFPHDKLEPGLNENAFYDPTNFTFPAGTYICEVEIDPATGTVKVDSFTAVDDFGTIINPMIVEGQVHGGLVQGIGQALLERCVYDRETGQLLTGSFMDYAMPRADDVPSFKVDTQVTACTHNPLGTKGCGEAGAIGSPPAR